MPDFNPAVPGEVSHDALLRLDGRVAIVTGGGGGIGRAIAERLAEAGAAIVLAGRKAATLNETGEALEAYGRPWRAVPADVTDAGAIEKLVAATLDGFGRIDIVINNAGGGRLLPIDETDADRWDKIFALNVRGPFLLTRAAGAAMRAAGRGVFVNLSSVAGTVGVHRATAYGASKSGVQSLTRSTAAEWGKYNIRANCIAPAFIATEMAVKVAERYGRAAFEAMAEATPLRRHGRPDDIARLALFLASDASSFISGQIISVDGGPAMGGERSED